MKYFSIFLFLFITSCSSLDGYKESSDSALINANTISDTEIAQLMIGSWAISPQDPTFFENERIVSTYKADGRVEFILFTTKKCDAVNFRTEAIWHIRNGHLIIEVISSDRPDIHPSGLIVIDQVVNVNTKIQILKSESGNLQYRVKNATCIRDNGI